MRATVLALIAAALGVSCGSSSPAAGTASPGTPSKAATLALVQVENISAARPQSGLQQAAIVYEYITEGGISRFSAVFAGADDARVGPVRSARLVTIRLARMYGAAIVYSGASHAVQQAIESSGVPHVEESTAGGDLFRTGDRAAPHNLFTDGQRLDDAVARAAPGLASATRPFWTRESAADARSARQASQFSVPISPSETPRYSYDATLAGWRRTEPDTGPFVDAASRRPVIAATVIVQQVAIVHTDEVEDVNGAHGVDLILTGQGTAQVFTAGREYDAMWSQPPSGPPSFTLRDGSPAPIADGLVWICLVASGQGATIG